jgi:hypothetical protein
MAAKKGTKKAGTKTTSTKKSAGRTATEDLKSLEEAREALGIPKGAEVSPTSATGQAIRTEMGQEVHPEGESRGAEEVSETQSEIVSDWDGPQKPVGLQAEPAQYAVNGSLEAGTVGSPSGPQPVAAVARSADEAQALLEKQVEQTATSTRSGDGIGLSEEQISTMSRASLQAVGSDRGYELPINGGTNTVRAAFRNAQGRDRNLSTAKK